MVASALTAEKSSARWLPERLGQLRPYAYHLAAALYLTLLLVADGAGSGATLRQQHALGVATFAFLFAATRFSPPAERRFVWLTVALWTLVELFASGVWGIYHYRLGQVPLFVPPGHGIIYLFGLRAGRTSLMQRNGRLVGRIALALAAIWALAGLTVLPLLSGRLDVAGAIVLPVLAFCILRSEAAPLYAAVFFATSVLEIVGTALGVWTWLPIQPGTHFPQGNPPSVVSAGYCLMDMGMLALLSRWQALALSRAGRALRERSRPSATNTA